MKKKIYIAAFVFIAAAIFLIFASICSDSQKNKINVSEKTLYGDPGKAAGTEIQTSFSMFPDLHWDARFTAGESKKAQISFSRKTDDSITGNDILNSFVGLTSYIYIYSGQESEAFCEYTDFSKTEIEDILAYAAEKTPAAQHTDIDIPLNRYRKYFSMTQLECSLPGFQFDFENPETRKKLGAYFRFPVSVKNRIRVNLDKDSEGNITDYWIEFNDYVDSVAAASRSGCYLAFTTPADEKAVSSGIHYIPFEQGDDGFIRLGKEEIRLIYPLSEDVSLLKLTESADGKNLFLFTEEKKEILLSVISKETGRLLQKLPLRGESAENPEDEDFRISSVIDKGDYLMTAFINGAVYFLEKNGSQYTVRLADNYTRAGLTENPEPYVFFDFDYAEDTFALTMCNSNMNGALVLFQEDKIAYAGSFAFDIAKSSQPLLADNPENGEIISVSLPGSKKDKEN